MCPFVTLADASRSSVSECHKQSKPARRIWLKLRDVAEDRRYGLVNDFMEEYKVHLDAFKKLPKETWKSWERRPSKVRRQAVVAGGINEDKLEAADDSDDPVRSSRVEPTARWSQLQQKQPLPIWISNALLNLCWLILSHPAVLDDQSCVKTHRQGAVCLTKRRC